MSRFDGLDPDSAIVEAWNPSHPNKGGGFRCIRGEFVAYFRGGRLERDIGAHIGRCWIMQHNEKLAGYITLLADKLEVELDEIHYDSYPAVKVGMLASDNRARGVGRSLIEWAMFYVASQLNPMVGVRFLTVDALFDPDSEYTTFGFYHKLGFRFADPDEDLGVGRFYRTMYIDLLPLINQLTEEELDVDG